ncbi:MFS transporter [Cryobacterium arcticum]|uniref:MFS transporter n=1 Tax=Cryobacterium arcticum TaxID=670052 RepID=A0A317ZV72_9MICO|nr:MFS transporter [Cryobacterium arcticum]PXA68057.1 MFS transporter [Cryobacterium arcticum]
MSQHPRSTVFNVDPNDDTLTTTNVVVGRTSLSKFNWRIAVALFIAGILWIGPYIGSIAVLLPAAVEQVAPADKVQLVGVLGILGAALSLVANIVFGALSDLTRSRFGARTPWVMVGAIATAVGLFGLSTAQSPTALILWWAFYMLFLNSIIAPMVAVISDSVPVKYRGTVSAIYGVSLTVGASLSTIIGAQFVGTPGTGLVVFAIATLASGVVFAVLMPNRSNRDQPRATLSARELLKSFSFPRTGARDFYFALGGKFFLQAGMFSITNYQLYILTDYIGLDTGGAAGLIAISATITLGASILFGFIAGPLSDRVGRRKPFVIGAALLIAIGVVFPLVAPFAWAMIAFAVFSGLGNATFTSVDQALNIEVLPDKATAAKDLGLLNMANSGGQILGPVVTSVLVASTGGYQATFIAAFVMLALAAGLILPIRKVR